MPVLMLRCCLAGWPVQGVPSEHPFSCPLRWLFLSLVSLSVK